MRFVITHFTTVAMLVMAGVATARASYTLNVKNGSLPAGVTASNAGGVNPDVSGYKRGYTTDGWIVDRFGTRGNILVSPTYTCIDEPCENVLTLPAVEIEAGDYLSWESRSALPGFNESYRVSIRNEEDNRENAEILFVEDSQSPKWTYQAVSLERFAGRKMIVEFCVTSRNRFLFCLDQVSIGSSDKVDVDVDRSGSIFYDEKDVAADRVSVTADLKNRGKILDNPTLECRIEGVAVDSYTAEGIWEPGEQINIQFRVPGTIDKKTSFGLWLSEQEKEAVNIYEGDYFCSDYRPNLMVDKGTGQWCNNCPKANLEIAGLEEIYGQSLIALDTHNNDRMANENYFSKLHYSEIPRMMLNRRSDTAGGNSARFENYIFKPCKWRIGIRSVNVMADGALRVTVAIESSETKENPSNRYRVGYVVTSDVYKPGQSAYYQENAMSTPAGEQYYYLPSRIPAPLNIFRHVTLTYENAFDGIEGSIPTHLDGGVAREYAFDIAKPDKLEDINEARIVVFIIDTQENGIILNSAAAEVGVLGSVDIAEDFLPEKAGIWNMQGVRVADNPDNLPKGIYICNGKKIIK